MKKELDLACRILGLVIITFAFYQICSGLIVASMMSSMSSKILIPALLMGVLGSILGTVLLKSPEFIVQFAFGGKRTSIERPPHGRARSSS